MLLNPALRELEAGDRRRRADAAACSAEALLARLHKLAVLLLGLLPPRLALGGGRVICNQAASPRRNPLALECAPARLVAGGSSVLGPLRRSHGESELLVRADLHAGRGWAQKSRRFLGAQSLGSATSSLVTADPQNILLSLYSAMLRGALIFLSGSLARAASSTTTSLYSLSARDLDSGAEVSLSKYAGHVSLVVNVASE